MRRAVRSTVQVRVTHFGRSHRPNTYTGTKCRCVLRENEIVFLILGTIPKFMQEE